MPHRARARALLAGSVVLAVALSGAVAAGPAEAAGSVVLDQAHLDTSVPGTVAFDVDLPLADTGTPALQAAQAVSMTLLVDFDGDGNADGSLVAAPSYDAWVLSGGEQFVQDAAPTDTSLAGWRTAFPDAEALTAGWRGAVGDVDQATVGSTTYSFTTVAITETVVHREDVSTSGTSYYGHNDFQPGIGVRVWTEGTSQYDLAVAYLKPDLDLPLADAANVALSRQVTSGSPAALQLILDLDGDGRGDARLVEGSAGDFVAGSATKQWVRDAAPDHSGGRDHGLLAEWRAAFPGALVLRLGWWLGPNLKGDNLVRKIVAGGWSFGFQGANRPPDAYASSQEVHVNTHISLSVQGNDPDGQTVTPEFGDATHGSIGAHGVFTPEHNFVGEATVQFREVDASGATSGWATDTISVTNRAPAPVPKVSSTPYDTSTVIGLPSWDDDDDPLVYSAAPGDPFDSRIGTVEFNGSAIYFHPATGFFGSATIPYVVSDGVATAQSYVVVDVGHPPPGVVIPDVVRAPSVITVRRINHSKRFHTYEFSVLPSTGPTWVWATGGTITVTLGTTVFYSQTLYGPLDAVPFGRTGRKSRRFTITYSGNQYLLPSSMTFSTKSKGPGRY